MTSVKTYRVEGLSAAVSIKAPVKVATTANITLSGEQTIDGVAVTMWPGYGVSSQIEDDRVLVKNQTIQTQNGIYLVKTTAWSRARDFDSGSEITQGTLIYVKQGTVNSNTHWKLTTSTNPITIGTDNITFEPAGVWGSTMVWKFDSSTTMADPGSGEIRLNNATISSVTAIAVSNKSADGLVDISDFVATWDDSTNTAHYGSMIIKKISAPENFAVFSLTGTVTDNTDWLQLTVTHVTSAGSFTASDGLSVDFSRTGNLGATGAQGDTYDIALNAGFDSVSVKKDIAVQTYNEWVMCRTGSFVGEAGYIDTAPTGAAAIVDILKNGTTIYTTKPQFAATANTLTAGTLKTDGTEDFVSGDRITFKITQIGSTEPGEGLRFTVKGTITA